MFAKTGKIKPPGDFSRVFLHFRWRIIGTQRRRRRRKRIKRGRRREVNVGGNIGVTVERAKIVADFDFTVRHGQSRKKLVSGTSEKNWVLLLLFSSSLFFVFVFFFFTFFFSVSLSQNLRGYGQAQVNFFTHFSPRSHVSLSLSLSSITALLLGFLST